MKLSEGEVLAFKTDTVWGLGCNPDDEVAVEKIYKIKKRNAKKPLILMSNDFSHLEKYIQNVPDYAHALIKEFLPGGLTMIFEKSELCPYYITSGNDTVGIRIPDSEDFSNLINELEDVKVLATTSCNISFGLPVENYREAVDKFSQYATIVKPLDGKKTDNIPSTVILCENTTYKVLRRGKIKL